MVCDNARQPAIGDAAVAEAMRLGDGVGIVGGLNGTSGLMPSIRSTSRSSTTEGDGPAQRAIDDVAPAQSDRRVQARHGGAGLHCLRSASPSQPVSPKRPASEVEVHADHAYSGRLRRKSLLRATPGEYVAQEVLDLLVVEPLNQPADPGDQVGPRAPRP